MKSVFSLPQPLDKNIPRASRNNVCILHVQQDMTLVRTWHLLRHARQPPEPLDHLGHLDHLDYLGLDLDHLDHLGHPERRAHHACRRPRHVHQLGQLEMVLDDMRLRSGIITW